MDGVLDPTLGSGQREHPEAEHEGAQPRQGLVQAHRDEGNCRSSPLIGKPIARGRTPSAQQPDHDRDQQQEQQQLRVGQIMRRAASGAFRVQW